MFSFFNTEEKIRAEYKAEYDKLAQELRDEYNQNRQDYVRDYDRAKDEYEYEKDQEIKELKSEHRDEIRDKDDEITTLNNKLDRMEVEHEARIEALEDAHVDEIITIKTKFKSLEEIAKEAHAAKQEQIMANAEKHATSVRSEAELKAATIIAEATRKGAEIEKNSQDQAMALYENHSLNLINRAQSIDSESMISITNLVKAIGDSYPKVAEISNTNTNKASL